MFNFTKKVFCLKERVAWKKDSTTLQVLFPCFNEVNIAERQALLMFSNSNYMPKANSPLASFIQNCNEFSFVRALMEIFIV
jgi:hypothetical protein